MSWTNPKAQLIQQVFLLRCAIANAIDKNPNVNHITYNEILEWLDEIMEMMNK